MIFMETFFRKGLMRVTTITIAFLLTISFSSLATEDAMFASSSMTIFKDKSGKQAIGSLEVGSKVSVIKNENGMSEVSIEGWRQKGLKCVIYAFEGKRIVVAELEPDGVNLVKVIKTVKDEDTQLVWEKVILKGVWVKSEYLVKNVKDVWDRISPLFHERCSMCHALPRTTTFTANQWPATLRVMTKRAALTKKQAEEVTQYLQYHAKDILNSESGHRFSK